MAGNDEKISLDEFKKRCSAIKGVLKESDGTVTCEYSLEGVGRIRFVYDNGHIVVDLPERIGKVVYNFGGSK